MSVKAKIFLFMLMDFIILSASWILGFYFAGLPVTETMRSSYLLFIIELAVMYVSFYFMEIYTNIWKYAGRVEFIKNAVGLALVICLHVIVCAVAYSLSTNWLMMSSIVFATLFIVSRMVYFLYGYLVKRANVNIEGERKRAVIIGGGDAGAILIRLLLTEKKLGIDPVCILDDDELKKNTNINGIKVVDKISNIKAVIERYGIDEIIFAIPVLKGKKRAEMIKFLQETGKEVLVCPDYFKLEESNESVQLKPVSIQDLLGREQVKVNIDDIIRYIENKIVLVTGGGGSIGSELCRQIAKHNPKQLIIFDIYENNAYDIQQELKRHIPNLNLKVLIGSVRDSKKINNLFAKYKPQIVFHAAAHKHVPLMEDSPNEAVKNNVSGTYKVASAAGENGVEKFILISTDKAVNPTNIMGATKRICEMIIQTLNHKYKTEYVAVRFGNVLGSNGSVIPLFKKQIEEGGPITVTDKDIVRYFMTIPEAVSLVLQAGAYAKGGEIFVLDMGEPVKIYDLAVNLIKLSGLEPFKDIDIKITGLRPGEKLYEERLMSEEGLKKTANNMISIGKPIEFDEKNLIAKIEELYVEAYNETDKMKELVHELVPTYKIDKSAN